MSLYAISYGKRVELIDCIKKYGKMDLVIIDSNNENDDDD